MQTLEQVSEAHDVQVNAAQPAQSHGLSEDEAKRRLEQFGPNVMTPPKRIPAWQRFIFHSLLNLFNVLLLVSGTLSFATYAIATEDKMPLYVGAVLVVVAFANASIEFAQEQKSAALLSGFMDLLPRKCSVIRNQQLVSIPASDLVPGDVVAIRMGDKVTHLKIFVTLISCRSRLMCACFMSRNSRSITRR